MSLVQFNNIEEFFTELTANLEQLDRKLVRVTNLYRHSAQSPIIQYVSVVATARVATDIIRLDIHCGELWSVDTQHNAPLLKKVEAVQQHIRTSCVQLGLEVRAGLLQCTKAK
jgi:hypothetical protein